MANHPLKEWRSIIVAVFILGIIAGANFWGNVSADSHNRARADGDGPGRSAEARIVHPPQNTAEREVIEVEDGAVDVTGGVSIGENVPGASPGTPSQPVPNFSAINTPVWVSSQGPAQIVDDLIVYGLTEVKGGLINNGGVAPPGGGGGGGGGGVPPPPQPDLTVDTPITIVPAVIQAGNSVTFNATVRNRGSITANASSTRIRIDGNPIGGNLGNNVATGALNVNATETEVWIWTATQGNHTVQVCADIATAVGESDEGNNCASQAFTVGAAPPPPPALNIAIASDTPAAGSVQQGSVDFNTTKFTLAASGANVTVTSIAMTRTGIASDSNLSNLKLYDASNTQIGTAQNLNTSTHKATFSSLNLPITAGDPQTLTVRTTVVSGQGNSFALSVSAGADVTATSSGNSVTPTGSAAGNSFAIAAPAQTLILTRVYTPAAGSALTSGTSMPLLRFDAQMNTGTVDLRQLFVIPKMEKSYKITNLKLINMTNGVILDQTADSVTVRGQDAYSFGYSSTSASNLLSIGTTITELGVTGNVACGNGAVEDHILEAAGDVIIRDAGVNIQTLPFATVSRTLTACPAPPAPTITTRCNNNGVSEITLAWTNTNRRGTAGYHIDVDQADAAANAFVNVAGPNDFLNTALIPANTLSATIPTATPLRYYDMTAGTRGGANQALLPNLNYFARIHYSATNEHSLLLQFQPASCRPPVPPRGGGTVKFRFPSILHGDGESSSVEPVTLFDAFIPQANAGWFAETANAQVLPPPPPTTLHPVYVFDDLYVYGNGATGPEPGNLFVRGGIVTEGNSNIGSVGSVTQFTGDVSVVGGTLSVGTLEVSGNLNVSRNLTVNGDIRANSIGTYSTLTSAGNAPSLSSNGWPAKATSSISCPVGDMVVSCSGFYSEGPAAGTLVELDSQINKSICEVRSRMSRADKIKVAAQAVCFSPN